MRLFFAAFFVSAQAFAWGPTGHRVVAELAAKRLDPHVYLKIMKLVGGHTLPAIANYADEVKSDPAHFGHTYNWHSTEWTDDQEAPDETKTYGKLITAMNEQLAVIKDPAAPNDKKAFAIKFYVHLMGDLHQPLHVGNSIDRGGNICKVKFHNRITNLHVVWDEAMIDFTRLSYTELSQFVQEGRTIADVQSWKQGSLLDWALESREIRKKVYPGEPSTYCKDGRIDEALMPKLGYDYSYQFLPVVQQRLYQAGLRLAMVLNDALK